MSDLPEGDADRSRADEPTTSWALGVSLVATGIAGVVSVLRWTAGEESVPWLSAFTGTAVDAWGGAWWLLVTTSFVHVDVIHLLFNGYWMVRLASPAERLVGWRNALLFGIVAGAFASALELLCADEIGYGLSGVVYAAFGFAWRRSKTSPEWAPLVPAANVRLFLGWLVVCVVATYAGVWNVANFAHAGGLLAGLAIARATEPGVSRWMRAALVGAPAVASTALLAIGPPWSGTLEAAHGLAAIHESDPARAIVHLERASELGANRAMCLCLLTWAYRHEGRTEDYDRAMRELKKLDRERYDDLSRAYAAADAGDDEDAPGESDEDDE